MKILKVLKLYFKNVMFGLWVISCLCIGVSPLGFVAYYLHNSNPMLAAIIIVIYVILIVAIFKTWEELED